MILIRFTRINAVTWSTGLLTFISIFPAVLFIAFAFRFIRPDTWANSDGRFFCPDYASNGTMISHDDDWSIGPDECDVPIQLGTLLPYALWMVSTYPNRLFLPITLNYQHIFLPACTRSGLDSSTLVSRLRLRREAGPCLLRCLPNHMPTK